MICDLKEIDQLGIFDGINEIIATTESEDGVFNAAPMGVIKKDDNLTVRLFAGSHTYENVMAKGEFVANVVHDPLIIVETALSDLSKDQFVRRQGVLTLKDAETWAFFKCDPTQVDISIPRLQFVKGEVLWKDFRSINRGTNLVIEAAVAATRYVALESDLYYDEIIRLRRIIGRCGGPRDIEAMQRLEELLGYSV